MFHTEFKAKLATVLYALAFLVGVQRLPAEVKLPSLVSDGMVLQQGMKVSIWGMARTPVKRCQSR